MHDVARTEDEIKSDSAAADAALVITKVMLERVLSGQGFRTHQERKSEFETVIMHRCLSFLVVDSFWEVNGGLNISVKGSDKAAAGFIAFCQEEDIRGSMFGGYSVVHLREDRSRERVFGVKFLRVPDHISKTKIEGFLLEKDLPNDKITIFKRRGTLQRSGLVKIDFADRTDAEKLLQIRLSLEGQHFPGGQWEDRVRVFHCYRCFRCGHVAARCDTEGQICVRCAGNHDFNEGRHLTPKFTNCSGRHYSSDRRCSFYRAEVQRRERARFGPRGPPSQAQPRASPPQPARG